MSRNSSIATALLIAVFSIAPTPSVFADSKSDFPGIRALMTAEEFFAAGLDALSEKELAALDAWLLRYTAGESKVLRTSSEDVKKAEKEIEIESRITGDFTGWRGKTTFTLENGQVWRQRKNEKYTYRGEDLPKVKISKNLLGFYKMELVDIGKSVGVTRVR